jgi:dTDP-4-dehydrorhamnose 3,5-epimerase-like enzyme
MEISEIKVFTDDRGTFRNIFDDSMWPIKRIYSCSNFSPFVMRGFHYHEYESKIFYVLSGAIKFIIIPMGFEQARYLKAGYSEGDINFPDLIASIKVFVLSGDSPATLYVPPGCANAWMSLQPDSVLMVASNKSNDESRQDDIRFSPDMDWLGKFWRTENR